MQNACIHWWSFDHILTVSTSSCVATKRAELETCKLLGVQIVLLLKASTVVVAVVVTPTKIDSNEILMVLSEMFKQKVEKGFSCRFLSFQRVSTISFVLCFLPKSQKR